MSKIFRLYKEGTSTYEDWNSSPAFPYNSTSRDTIEDPDGASARHEITSIPSPFARIDLIKTAFKEVCKPDKRSRQINLDGNTIFHKMVSDTLDVAEIFFNLDKYIGKVEVIKWDPSLMLSELEDSGIVGHQYYADALKKYMQSDSITYNFGTLKNIYLLNYIEGPDELNIIGATSPATLFFSNANDLSYITDIYFGEDKPFDNEYQPLYKRDFEFIKYLFALRKSIPNFAGLFPEVESYLSATFKAISDQAKKNELNNITPIVLEEFNQIDVVGIQQNDYVEVLGYPLYQKAKKQGNTVSDFSIKPSVPTEIKPLILPVEAGNKYSDLIYTSGKWGKTNRADYSVAESDLSKRALPFDGTIAPFLTLNDFLEEYAIRVPYTLNSEHYFNGNIDTAEPNISYLLPIKPMFFDYFNIEDLRGRMSDGKPMLEINTYGGKSGLRVTLRIPIRGNNQIAYIEYCRTYYNERKPDIANNEGGIVEIDFTGFIMPQVKFQNQSEAIYNVSCIQHFSRNIKFEFYKNSNLILPAEDCRNKNQEYQVRSDNYLIEKTNFDFIRVKNHDRYGIIVPIFKPHANLERFEFAIDLGTSNTHIEYRKNGDATPIPFGFTHQDTQICNIFLPTLNEIGALENLQYESELIEKDFMPAQLGNEEYSFPTRTVLACAKTTDWNNIVNPYQLVNLPFTYDKRRDLKYNNYRYNIKWGKGEDLSVMKAYVNTLMLMIRNKVLLNNGDLQSTKITWFYPISMSNKRLTNLKRIWDESYNLYFGENGTLSISESNAPIQYFFRRYSTATDLINVDIGGGTTDIAFAKDKAINIVTSFKFASNALFENPYSDFDYNNGIVDFYKGYIHNILINKNLRELCDIFESSNNHKPSNMASFLFSLKDNAIPKKHKIDANSVDFNFILQQDEHFKIVFILFYTAIIYHIAHIIKYYNLELPRHISFSGNGSKVIRIITTDSKLLSKYTKLVFERILGKPYGKELDILGLDKDSNPKESTCKGGIICNESDEFRDKIIAFTPDKNGEKAEIESYASISDLDKSNTIKSVKEFLNFTLNDMNSVFNFDDNFGVTTHSLKVARDVAFRDLSTFLDKGIAQCLEEANKDDKLQESLFFYPIKGALNTISAEIYESLKN